MDREQFRSGFHRPPDRRAQQVPQANPGVRVGRDPGFEPRPRLPLSRFASQSIFKPFLLQGNQYWLLIRAFKALKTAACLKIMGCYCCLFEKASGFNWAQNNISGLVRLLWRDHPWTSPSGNFFEYMRLIQAQIWEILTQFEFHIPLRSVNV